ncbi:MAG: ECF-type sigma factor [Planctomycetota bacterium]
MAAPGPSPDDTQEPVPLDPDLYAAVESELHAIAANLMRAERSNHTLQPTALMNEAWLRLSRADPRWRDHAHFVRTAARTMRRVLVEHARSRARDKRDGGNRLTLTTELLGDGGRPEDLLTVEDVLGRLEALDPELARIVELRVFGGLDHPAIAAATERSLRSVERGWRLARAFLARELQG